MKFTTSAALATIAAVALAAPAIAQNMDNGRKLTAMLDGASEVPGPGDADGTGMIDARVNPGQGTFCYTLNVSDIDPAAAAHIHEAPAGEAGPVVITLEAPTDGMSEGCVDISRELAMELVQSPEDYYANVHNPAFPAGAVRGQLSK